MVSVEARIRGREGHSGCKAELKHPKDPKFTGRDRPPHKGEVSVINWSVSVMWSGVVWSCGLVV